MRFFILNGLSTFLVFPILMSGTALSADLSAYEREGYDRILVEGSPLESIDKGDKAITITFREAKPSLNGVEAVGAAKSVQSAMQQGQTLTITFNDVVQSIRNFQIGNRLVIDVFYDRQLVENEPQTELAIEETTSTPTQVQTPEPSPTPINEPAAKPTEEQPKAEEQKVPEPENPAIEEKNTEQTSPQESPDDLQTIKEVDEPAPVLTDAEVLPELADATIVTVSSTSPFALAVFERYNRLFIVTDQEEMVVPPQIAGAGKDAKWKLSEVEIDGGRAWSMPIPGNAFIRPEGSGLVWRIVISDVDPQLKGADIRRRLADPSDLKIDIMMEDAVELLRLRDPDYGDDLAVVTVSRPQSRMLKPYDFVDFDVIPAVSGAVIKPESDGLRIVSTPQFVTVGKNGGLDMARESQNVVLQQVMKEEERAILDDADPEGDGGENSFDRVFFFTDWGGTLPGHEFVERRKELDQFLVDAPKQSKTGIIINMVKLSLAQGMGPETLGYLSLLEAVNPQIGETVEYKTMRGAAHFLARQYDRAEQYLKDPELDQITEVRLWRAATLAAQGQEEDAMDIYQEGDGKIAASYPYRIRMDVLAPLVLALVNEDKAKEALNLVHQVDEEGQRRTAGERATLAYLKGRANRMAGNIEESLSDLGQAALVDKLGPYGVRSEMMLIQDELNREVTDYDEAIKRMERLRFAWRGDHLEYEIYEQLGKLYIDHDKPRQGLNVLQRAAENTQSVPERREIVRMMAKAYKDVFLGEDFADLDPLLAVMVYDEFKELTPVGDEGDQLIDRLADKLMDINLYSRAVSVLQDKMERLGEGQHAIKTGLRIAATQLLDRQAQAARETLQKVDDMLSNYSGEDKDDMNQKVVLLKARALADTGDYNRALFMTEGLDDTADVLRLRIDTAWRAGEWVKVSDNLSKLLAGQNLTMAAPPTADQVQMILNQAVALNLSEQYDAVQRFAAKYDMIMKQSPAYKTFQIITRPRNLITLADRETLMNLTSEVDLFESFLTGAK